MSIDLLNLAMSLEKETTNDVNPVDSMFDGVISQQMPEQDAPVTAEMSKVFVNLKENPDCGLDQDKAVTLSSSYDIGLWNRELGTDTNNITVIPIKTSGESEKFTEDIDYGGRAKEHLDHLCKKYDIVVVPRWITGFSNMAATPDEYIRVDHLGQVFYSSKGVRRVNLVEETIEYLKQTLMSKGSVSIQIMKDFFKDEGKTSPAGRTLCFNLDEIQAISEAFSSYSPCLASAGDDVFLVINPTSVPRGDLNA